MRPAVVLVFALMVAAPIGTPAVSGQDAKSVKRALPTAPRPDVAAYLLTRLDGNTYTIGTFHVEGTNYVVEDLHGHKMQHRADAIASIEPMPPAEGAKAVKDAAANPAAESAGPRSTARTTARGHARATTHKARKPGGHPTVFDYDWTAAASAAGLGTTPTGLQLYMGPRGGVYHISSGGNKVYERHN